jgi:hypothetical protein
MSAGKRHTREPALPVRRRKKSSPPPLNSADNAELLRTLKEIFNELNNVKDVLIVCGEACGAGKAAQNEEVANVIRRGGIDLLFTQRQRLSKVVEGLGGETYLTGDGGDDE